MKRLIGGALVALVVAMAWNGGVSAQEPSVAPNEAARGNPEEQHPLPPGYSIWVEGNRVHLRTTDRGGPASVYTGQIETDGLVRDVTLVRPEDPDWAVADGDTLRFHFRTGPVVDGVDFTVRDGSRLVFRLYRNGELIRTELIHLGVGGTHPPGNPFVIFY